MRIGHILFNDATSTPGATSSEWQEKTIAFDELQIIRKWPLYI